MPRFRSVILDVDSTLCSIEGIDWLATRRSADIARRIAEVTERAMNGEVALESVYAERLALVAPDASLLDELARQYLATITPGAEDAIRTLRGAGVEVAIVSGGIYQAILPLAERLEVPRDNVRAVVVQLGKDGLYGGYDHESSLATDTGKAQAARGLMLPAPVLAVGDGATDLAMRPAVDAFAAYVGHVRRAAVTAAADHTLDNFEQLTELVLA